MKLDRITVATFNLYNLQLPGRPMNPGQRPWSEDEYARKIAWTGARLAALDADVVGFQELWHREALADAVASAGLTESHELVADAATGGRIVCAALVRKGLRAGEPEWIDSFPDGLRLQTTNPLDLQAPGIAVSLDRFARPVLRLSLLPREGEVPTQLYVTHLKSKLPIRIDPESWYRDEPERYKPHATAIGAALATIQRTAEAAALRVLLTEVMKGTVTPVIVLGDVNDGQHSNTVNILTEQPRYLVGESRGGADIGLYTAQTLQEYRDTRDVYYTHVHEDLRESLDHVLVSEQFYDNSRQRLWLFDGLSIANDHLDDADHRLVGSGDHGIVAVAFRYRPYQQR